MQFLYGLHINSSQKKVLKIFAFCLAFFMILSTPSALFGQSYAAAVSQSDVDNLEDELDNLQTKKDDLQAQIESLEGQQDSALEKKLILDEKINVTRSQIDAVTAQIEVYVNLISDKEAEIAQLEEDEAKQLELYKERIRAMEERGEISYYEIIFGASNFSDLLSRLDFIGEIMEYDEQVYQDLINAKAATQSAKAELETEKLAQEAVKAELEALEADLDSQVSQVTVLIVEIQNNIADYEQLYSEAEQDEIDAQAEINRLNAELEAQRKKAAEEAEAAANAAGSGGSNVSAPAYSGDGTLIWPSNYNRITSPFGNRYHPILGVYKDHTGVDIGAASGSNVYAAASGTVLTATYNSGYGYYVVISHGSMTTLYAHCSSLNVSVGQSVSQGQVIAYSGSTGLSTGPHLHFEVSVNGSRIDPLSQYSAGTWVQAW